MESTLLPPSELESYSSSSPELDKKEGLKNKYRELKNEEKAANLKYRGMLVWWTTFLTSVYLIFVVIFLCVYATKNNFKFSENLMITLLATTTATVLGLPAIVLKGLFSIRLADKE